MVIFDRPPTSDEARKNMKKYLPTSIAIIIGVVVFLATLFYFANTWRFIFEWLDTIWSLLSRMLW